MKWFLIIIAVCVWPVSADTFGEVPATTAATPNAADPPMQPTTQAAPLNSSTTTPSTPYAPASTAPAASEGFAPFLLLMVLGVLILFIIVILFFIIAGFVVAVFTAALVIFGIVSSSVLIGLIRRTPRSAFKAFLIQASAITGLPLGVLAMWFENRTFHLLLSHWALLIVGAPAGLAVGAATGLAVSYCLERFVLRLLAWLQQRRAAEPTGGFPVMVKSAVDMNKSKTV